METSNKTKVLVADLFSEEGIKEMHNAGMDVVYNQALNGESLTKAMSEIQPHILVVRSTKVTADMINADPKLQLVMRAGAGYDTIDVAHCAKQGIYVTNCPGKNACAVAELAMALMLAIDRRIAEGVMLLKDGKWNKGMFANCVGIKGRTLGLIGFGSIAQLVCTRAKAFEMNVLVYNRNKKVGLDKKMGFEYASTMEDLLKQSDIVSLHVPSTPETKNMVNKNFLSLMKDDAMLINTARGNVIVDADLLEKLNSCPNFWYGADVYNNEPTGKDGVFDTLLTKHERVYGTHHIGASTKQAESAIGDEAVRVIKQFVKTGVVDTDNCVNREKDLTKLHKMSIRHFDKVGVLSHVFQIFANHNWNVQELENIVFKERQACVCNILFLGDLADMQNAISALKLNEHILDISL